MPPGIVQVAEVSFLIHAETEQSADVSLFVNAITPSYPIPRVNFVKLAVDAAFIVPEVGYFLTCTPSQGITQVLTPPSRVPGLVSKD